MTFMCRWMHRSYFVRTICERTADQVRSRPRFAKSIFRRWRLTASSVFRNRGSTSASKAAKPAHHGVFAKIKGFFAGIFS